MNDHNGRDGHMKRLSLVSLALVALVGSVVGLYAAESETFTGTAAASGTSKRQQLLVAGKRYEQTASDKADASVAQTLAKFSKGGTGTYAVKGVRGTVNASDGIIVDRITPAASKRAGSFSVKDLGAKGDGVVDDTSAVQSAINRATKSGDGGTVIFPKGTYLLNSAYSATGVELTPMPMCLAPVSNAHPAIVADLLPK